MNWIALAVLGGVYFVIFCLIVPFLMFSVRRYNRKARERRGPAAINAPSFGTAVLAGLGMAFVAALIAAGAAMAQPSLLEFTDPRGVSGTDLNIPAFAKDFSLFRVHNVIAMIALSVVGALIVPWLIRCRWSRGLVLTLGISLNLTGIVFLIVLGATVFVFVSGS